MVRKSSSVSLGNLSNLNCSDGKEARQVMTQTANDVDQVKRSSSPNLTCTGYGNLRHCFRNSITGERLQMALPIGSVD
jgi:hypothetical protein